MHKILCMNARDRVFAKFDVVEKPKVATPYSSKKKWKGLYKGKWYEIENVEDQGEGKQNLYRLKGVPKLVPIEDMSM